MTKYVALLRGINVGGNAKVEMTRLRTLFAALGHTGVSTYINSGNVLFETNKTDTLLLTGAIEHALKKEFGFPIPVLLRDATQIARVAAAIPAECVNGPEYKADVLFLWRAFDTKQSLSLLPLRSQVDHVSYVAGTIIWWIRRSDYTKSGMHAFIGTDLYKHMTARNVNTVRKLASLMNDVPKAKPQTARTKHLTKATKDTDVIGAYIATFPRPTATILRRMRTLIARTAPKATERMSYGIPTFDLNGKHLIHFAGYKTHIGVYPTPSGMRAFAQEFAPYKTSKGAVQFPLDQPIPYDLIKKVVAFRVGEVEEE